MKLIFPIIILFLFTSYSKEKETDMKDSPKLLFVFEHFRHGAREPYIKIDPITWIDFIGVQWKSQGELNSIGLRAQYLLGAATRNRYNDFLSKTFDPNEILIISTDVNRTIVSAMANLQGIYNKTTTRNLTDIQINNSIINNFNETYQKEIDRKIDNLKNSYIETGISIIPIHLFSKYRFLFKLSDSNYCPGIQKYKDEAKNSEAVQKILKEFYQLTNDTYGEYIFKFMNISWEKDPNYIFEDSNLYYICDAYIADYISGRYMPHIENTGIDMEAFYHHALNHSMIDTYYVEYGIPPTKASYISVSPMFRSVFDYMDKRIYINENDNSDKIDKSAPKYVIYSGHDSTVGGVDVFLKAEFNISYENPEYTTSQYFELWENGPNNYTIIYLVNQEIKATFQYNEFKKNILNKIIPQDEIEKICSIENNNEYDNVKIIKKQNIFKKIFFIVVSIGIVSLLLIFSLLILDNKRKQY